MEYLKFFAGYVFIIGLNIQKITETLGLDLGEVDILPDIFCYLLFYWGLKTLKDENKFFKFGEKLSFILIMLSLSEIVIRIGGWNLGIYKLIMETLIFLLYLLAASMISKGIYLEFKKTGQHFYAEDTKEAWTNFVKYNLIAYVVKFLPIRFEVKLVIMGVMLFLAYTLIFLVTMEASRKLGYVHITNKLIYNKFVKSGTCEEKREVDF